jgi:hypothetical protein
LASSRSLFEETLDFRAAEPYVTTEPNYGKLFEVAVDPATGNTQDLRYLACIEKD